MWWIDTHAEGRGGDRRTGDAPRILVYGYGNPGRQDDGVGIALVDELEAAAGGRENLRFDRDYQLNVEHAWEASRHDVVVFVDASRDQSEGFRFRPVRPAHRTSFTTHAMSPESVLALCRDLYGARPSAHLLTVRGYSWEPNATMTAQARENLQAAKEHLLGVLTAPGQLRKRTS
jgi:hydrogenase maturation protease